MASEEAKDKKSKGRNNDATQQTMTLTFIPETNRYESPKNMEEHIRSYFESINGINKRIIAEERRIIAQNRNTWPTLPVEERDKLLNDRLISSEVRQKYNNSEEYWDKKTPWQPDELLDHVDKSGVHEKRTDSMSNDSFSTPFHWATKSQRNIRFPELKREKLKKINKEQETPESKPKPEPEPSGSVTEKDQAVEKLNNVEKSIKEKQIKTKNDNIKGNIGGSNLSFMTKKEDETDQRLLENNNMDVTDQGEASSEQVKLDEKQYLDGTKNIFEFLQSWDP